MENKIPLHLFVCNIRYLDKLTASEDPGVALGARKLLDHYRDDYRADDEFAYVKEENDDPSVY